MNLVEKYLYHFGLKKFTFDTITSFKKKEDIEGLKWLLTVDDLLIQEKTFITLCKSPSTETLLHLCDYASRCSWQLNFTVYSNLLRTLNLPQFESIKIQKQVLFHQMLEVLESEKVERTPATQDGRELPSDRLKQLQKDHRHFIERGLKELRKK